MAREYIENCILDMMEESTPFQYPQQQYPPLPGRVIQCTSCNTTEIENSSKPHNYSRPPLHRPSNKAVPGVRPKSVDYSVVHNSIGNYSYISDGFEERGHNTATTSVTNRHVGHIG